MTLAEGIKLKGSPTIINNCERDELPQFLAEQGFKTGAEVGVYKGAFTARFCQAGLKMFAVDPWMAFTGQGRSQDKQEVQDELYEIAKTNLGPYLETGQCQIIRRTSIDASRQFRHGSLDFVYIDGNHEFPNVTQDLYEWNKIVRPGGIMSGHDYFNTWEKATNVLCHVKSVVDAYTSCFKIENWWLFGNPKFQSWMWFKP